MERRRNGYSSVVIASNVKLTVIRDQSAQWHVEVQSGSDEPQPLRDHSGSEKAWRSLCRALEYASRHYPHVSSFQVVSMPARCETRPHHQLPASSTSASTSSSMAGLR